MEPSANGVYERVPEAACFSGNLGIAALAEIAKFKPAECTPLYTAHHGAQLHIAHHQKVHH